MRSNRIGYLGPAGLGMMAIQMATIEQREAGVRVVDPSPDTRPLQSSNEGEQVLTRAERRRKEKLERKAAERKGKKQPVPRDPMDPRTYYNRKRSRY